MSDAGDATPDSSAALGASGAVGGLAPDFDLTSTEGVVLMLRDEVVRTAVVLYFFAAAGERELGDLDTLNRQLAEVRKRTARILAVSPLPLATLQAFQRERHLLFPLLHDDRGFSAAYGVAPHAEGTPAPPALALVDRRQTLRLFANPVASVAETLAQIDEALEKLPSPTDGYPKSIINKLIDRWVN